MVRPLKLHTLDATGEPDGRFPQTQGGRLVYGDAPGGGGVAGPSLGVVRSFMTGRYYGPAAHVPGTASQALGILTAVPMWVGAAFTVDQIAVEVTAPAASGGVVRLGIYGSTGSDAPGGLLLDAGAVSTTTAGVKTIAISQPLSAGLYWLAAVNQGATATMRTVGNNGLAPVAGDAFDASGTSPNCYFATAVTGSLPASWPALVHAIGGKKVMVRAA